MKRKRKVPMSRSENMSRIKGKNTKPELFLRKLLWHDGFRYRTNYKGLPGKPDIYLSSKNTAIFINGCFWHGHAGCRYASMPKNNHDFWFDKIATNRARDAREYEELMKSGLDVIVVWECTIRKMSKSSEECRTILQQLENMIDQDSSGIFFEM